MRFSVYNQFGATNSAPFFDAVRQGLLDIGHQVNHHDDHADVAVIWSQLWAGRMRRNLEVWEKFRSAGKPVLVIEVGAIKRGETWRIMINGNNNMIITGNDAQRRDQLGLKLHPWRRDGTHIVIALQRPDSRQWQGQPPLDSWLSSTVDHIRKYSRRPIVVRPHPRYLRVDVPARVTLQQPQQLPNTYDCYDFARALDPAWCVINHNSTPAVSAVIQGVPVFVHDTSLAATVGNRDFSRIEDPDRPDREQWLNDLAHTEWTEQELRQGDYLRLVCKRLLPLIAAPSTV